MSLYLTPSLQKALPWVWSQRVVLSTGFTVLTSPLPPPPPPPPQKTDLLLPFSLLYVHYRISPQFALQAALNKNFILFFFLFIQRNLLSAFFFYMNPAWASLSRSCPVFSATPHRLKTSF
jgi:hypothetical protein